MGKQELDADQIASAVQDLESNTKRVMRREILDMLDNFDSPEGDDPADLDSWEAGYSQARSTIANNF